MLGIIVLYNSNLFKQDYNSKDDNPRYCII